MLNILLRVTPRVSWALKAEAPPVLGALVKGENRHDPDVLRRDPEVQRHPGGLVTLVRLELPHDS
jgi:hypothetical protein